MPCELCSIRQPQRDASGLCLVPATADMGLLLAGLLKEQGIPFERRGLFVELTGTGDHGRVVALLRQLLSEPERQAVGVYTRGTADRFPAAQQMDQWWRIHETGWFAEALAGDRFETWFQPIVDTTNRRVLAHECLIRLNAGRMFSGGEIVDAAVARNEIHAFDSYARRLAIRSAGAQGLHGDPRYFINFMPSSIYKPEHCMQSTLQAMAEFGLKPENIVFEVVESDLVRDAAHLRRICDYYRRHGFAFALDDVGTGANSLQMVCDLHPNYIKIDKSLTVNVEQPMYAATIGKLVELAGQFGVGVIAEGVEKVEVMESLWLLGVQLMQGYLFGRPADKIVREKAFFPESDLMRRDLGSLSEALAASEQTSLVQ